MDTVFGVSIALAVVPPKRCDGLGCMLFLSTGVAQNPFLSDCVWDDTFEPRSCYDQVGICDHVVAMLIWWSGQGC